MLPAYLAGLDAAIDLLRRVDAVGREQRAALERDELAGLGPMAVKRAQLMHELTAIDAPRGRRAASSRPSGPPGPPSSGRTGAERGRGQALLRRRG